MKKLLLAAAAFSIFASSALADQWVNGYTRRDGTYVAGHWRSSPNSTKADNWSTYPNVNPYTGKQGTKKADDGWLKPPSYYGPSNGLNNNDSGSRYNPYKPLNPYETKGNCPKNTSIYAPRCN